VSIAIENLPHYEAISCTPISEAAAGLDAAKAACLSAQRDLTELEQTREQAEWADAEAAENARAEGKAEPKRSHIAEHDKKLDVARHEHKVAELAQTRACGALEAALAEHGEAWAYALTTSIEAMKTQWERGVGELIGVHGQLGAAVKVARAVGIGELPSVGVLPFARKQIKNVEFASGQRPAPAYVSLGDVLAALASVTEPEPDIDPSPVKHPPLVEGRGSALLRGQTGVESEIAERSAFAEQSRDPERVAERRRRSGQLREQNRIAVEEQAVI
jgi:hypothetical protein